MILGPLESFDLLRHMGKLPNLTSPDDRRRINDGGLLLPFPHPLKNQTRVLAESPAMTKDSTCTLRKLGLNQERYTLFVGSGDLRRRSSHYKCIVYEKPLPPGSILQVVDDIQILCPGLCLLLLARNSQIGDVELVYAASQLCSRYAISTSPDKELIERIPHTSTARIRGYLDELRDLCDSSDGRLPKGMNRLLRLLPYVHDGARSPREISACIMMSWPKVLGGFEIPPFEMNKTIGLSRQEQLELGKQHLESDFTWEEQGLILEYNGGVHDDQLEPDSARTNVLRDKGYTVEIMTKRIFDNFDSYIKFMNRFEHKLGFRIRHDAESVVLQRSLHARVLALANSGGELK